MGIPRQGYWVGSHFFLQGIFRTQGLNPSLLRWQVDSLPLSHMGSPRKCLKEHEVCLIYPACFSAPRQGFPPCHKSVCWGSHQILHGSGKLWTSGKHAVHLGVPSVLSWSERIVLFWKTDCRQGSASVTGYIWLVMCFCCVMACVCICGTLKVKT